MSYISLPSKRLTSDVDDNEALRKAVDEAVATGLPIYLPERQGKGPNGEYIISTKPWVDGQEGQTPAPGNLKSGVVLYGDGMYRSVVQQKAGSDLLFLAHSRSTSLSDNLTGITLRDLSLRGNIVGHDPTGYNEFNHLVQLAGVSNFMAERVEFWGFMGDGICLGGPRRDLVPHNYDVNILNCRFDGVTKQNRNGISILDCTRWRVEGCAFINVGGPIRSPGAIDVEPEDVTALISQGTVYNNSFEDLGGFALALLVKPLQQTPTDIQFTYCSVRRSAGAFINDGHDGANVRGLYVEDVQEPFVVRRTRSTALEGNTFRVGDMSRIGGSTSGLVVQNNAFVKCGKTNGPVITQDGSIDGVQILQNRAIDCGRQGLVSPFYFVQTVDGDVRNLKVNGNTVTTETDPVLKVTDIGRVTGGRNPAAAYANVQKLNNSPAAIPGGAENLYNT